MARTIIRQLPGRRYGACGMGANNMYSFADLCASILILLGTCQRCSVQGARPLGAPQLSLQLSAQESARPTGACCRRRRRAAAAGRSAAGAGAPARRRRRPVRVCPSPPTAAVGRTMLTVIHVIVAGRGMHCSQQKSAGVPVTTPPPLPQNRRHAKSADEC